MNNEKSKSISEKMDCAPVEAPEESLVEQYEKKGWWTRIVTSVDTWHRWIDLILKVAVSAVIIYLLWEWINFVMRAISGNQMTVPVSVQIALVTGTSVNIIGLLGIMAKYLFPPDRKK